jgi:glucose/arabinose dehydrogenase
MNTFKICTALIALSFAITGCGAQQGNNGTGSTTANNASRAKRTSNPSGNNSTSGNTSGLSQVYPPSIAGINEPVAMAFTPDKRILITERTGAVRVIENGKLRSAPYVEINVPKIKEYNETGVLGIAIDPNFKAKPYVYIYRTCSKNGRLFNKVIRVTDVKGSGRDPEIILDNIPGGRVHNGGILVFGPDRNLYISTGETGNKSLAQNLKSYAGKILRIKPDGSIPADNPFADSPVYSYGHRNVFGIAFDPRDNNLYITENGPDSDDEINRIVPGGNYGWPLALGFSLDSRFINPIKVYQSVIAPTQAFFYTGPMFKSYKNWMIFGSYNKRDIHALNIVDSTTSKEKEINSKRVAEDKIIYRGNEQISGVAQSPDGGIYVIGTKTIKKLTSLD